MRLDQERKGKQGKSKKWASSFLFLYFWICVVLHSCILAPEEELAVKFKTPIFGFCAPSSKRGSRGGWDDHWGVGSRVGVGVGGDEFSASNCRPLCLWLSGRPGVRSYLEVAARPPLIMIQYTPSPPWLHAANTNKRTNGAATFNAEGWATFPLELVIREVLEHNYSSCIHSLQNLKN